VHTIILPKENETDMRDVPEPVRQKVKFIFVEHMDEVLPVALHGNVEPVPVAAD
jgi:ATP-dependent Lon protease